MVKSHMSKVRKARRIQRRVRRVGTSSVSAAERELMTLAGLEVQEGELRLIPGWDEEVSETLAATKAAGDDGRPRLVQEGLARSEPARCRPFPGRPRGPSSRR